MKEKVLIKTPWFLNTDEILNKLETKITGLEENEVENRLNLFGKNNFKNKKQPSIIKIGIKQFKSPLIFILFSASILTSILGEWINTIVILLAIFINVGLGLYREYQAENTLEKLESYIKDRSRVVRNGQEKEIDSSLLVPGDIIKLFYGARIPADARIISENNLKVDEAVLTGESAPVSKDNNIIEENSQMADRINMVYAGSLVVNGFGEAVITSTGPNTEIGKIANIVENTERAETPIQKGINQLSWYIFAITIFIIIGIFVLGVLKGEHILEMLILSAAIAVGAVPESLPIALTVILSVGAERIAFKKGIIRKLAAAETLGSATLVLTDKTGTLTKAEMQLVGIYTIDVLKNDDYKDIEITHLSLEQKEILNLALNNIDAIVENPKDKEEDWNLSGHPFEVNIVKASILHNIEVRKKILEENNLYIPFNSTNKYSISKVDGKYIIMGAPDILLSKSDMNKEDYLKVLSWIENASLNGKRLIAVGTFSHIKEEDIKNGLIKDIKFEGILSFFDPVRKEVPKAIRDIQSHNVKVVIITGDLKGTALSLAKSLGWEVLPNEILSGEDIHSMSDEELLDVISKIKIFARVTPEDKFRIANLYRKLGEIVAMTGDGVNDAPALKSVDIGISLGTGSDVAQSAADLVLLDDNFKTISMAIDEGRRILVNIRKTFIYLMSNALDEVFVISGSLIANIALPINALQIIWVNLFTGSLPALAFAYDENLDKYAENKLPKKKLLTREVKILSFGLGTITSFLIFLLYYFLIKRGLEVSIARSIFFACFSIYVLVISFSFRSLYKPIFSYNIFSNKKLNISILIGILILIITMSIPFMRKIFDIAPMPFSYLWLVILWAIFNIFLVEFAKFIFRLRLKYRYRD